MLTIAKGRPIEIRCYYATETDGNPIIASADEVRATLAGTAVITGADYITVEQDVHGDTYYRLRFVKFYTLRRLNPCAYMLRLQIGERKLRIKDIFAIDTYRANDNTGLQPGDTCVIRLTLTEAATGAITWAEDVTVPGTLQAIHIGGTAYTMDEGVIVLPDYPSQLSELTPDDTHQTVSASDKEAWNQALQKIPAGASPSNKLVTNTEMNNAIDQASPVYRGMNDFAQTEEDFLAWADLLTHNLNDYVLWKRTDAAGNVTYTKYRYDGDMWQQEFSINSNSFTAAQWAAINSGITSAHLLQIDENIAYLLAAIQDAATIEQLDQKLDKFSLGAHDLPVWFDENKQPQVIDALKVPGNIQSTNGGVAAFGIADLSISGINAGGTVTEIRIDGRTQPQVNGVVDLPAYPTWDTLEDRPQVAEYADLNDASPETTSVIPTAKSAAVFKMQMDVESMDEFSTSRSYKRGETCKVTDSAGFCRGYRFVDDKSAGDWDGTAVERLSFKTLANPLNIPTSTLNTILD